MKLNHNKKRNTAFLYESLIAELTKNSLKNNKEMQEAIIKILKEYFGKTKILAKELKLYKEISELDGYEKNIVTKIVEEAKKRRESLDDKEIFNEQTKLINRINKIVGKGTYDNFVPNYKNLASIYQIFNDSTPIKAKVILESSLINQISKTKAAIEEATPKVSKAVYKIFTKKFNEKYGELLENQKTLLKLYIESVQDQGLELQSYINEEINYIRQVINEFSNTEEGKSLHESVKKIKEELDSFKGQYISEDIIKKILKMQSLTEEIKNG
tara:strand:- start:2911 stop:3723 length:813 start_codon:yes stop_codon:yes gene_type:complete